MKKLTFQNFIDLVHHMRFLQRQFRITGSQEVRKKMDLAERKVEAAMKQFNDQKQGKLFEETT